MNKELLELYSDYLLSSFGAITATGLSAMPEGEVSHDRITRFLSIDRRKGFPDDRHSRGSPAQTKRTASREN